MRAERNWRDEEEYEEWLEARRAARAAQRQQTPPRRSSNAPAWTMTLAMLVATAAFGVFLFKPDLLGAPGQAGPAAQPQATIAPQPTLTAAQLEAAAAAARAAAEQQAVQQAVPTPDTSVPPPLPVQATAAAIQQPAALDSVPAQNLSPVDLGWRPVATPTTMLSPEQYEASQASEEQNFINNELQNLTNAQQMVKVHEAEQNAQGQP